MTEHLRAYAVLDDHTIDTGPPERLEARVGQCEAIIETGERCRTLTLHERCHRHRGRSYWRREEPACGGA
jgi:hypothetical protein